MIGSGTEQALDTIRTFSGKASVIDVPDDIAGRIAEQLEGLPDEIMDGIAESIRNSSIVLS